VERKIVDPSMSSCACPIVPSAAACRASASSVAPNAAQSQSIAAAASS
jgi:hypothetical protein